MQRVGQLRHERGAQATNRRSTTEHAESTNEDAKQNISPKGFKPNRNRGQRNCIDIIIQAHVLHTLHMHASCLSHSSMIHANNLLHSSMHLSECIAVAPASNVAKMREAASLFMSASRSRVSTACAARGPASLNNHRLRARRRRTKPKRTWNQDIPSQDDGEHNKERRCVEEESN